MCSSTHCPSCLQRRLGFSACVWGECALACKQHPRAGPGLSTSSLRCTASKDFPPFPQKGLVSARSSTALSQAVLTQARAGREPSGWWAGQGVDVGRRDKVWRPWRRGDGFSQPPDGCRAGMRAQFCNILLFSPRKATNLNFHLTFSNF